MHKCTVIGCRYPNTHVTLGHQCGTCNKYGHGQIECSSNSISNMNLHQRLPTYAQCTIPNCKFKTLHTMNGHKCSTCNTFHSSECPQADGKLQCPQCRTPSFFQKPHRQLFLNKSECPVCLSSTINCILNPCGHGICSSCADTMEIKNLNPNSLYSNLEIIPEDDIPTHFINDFKQLFSAKDVNVVKEYFCGMGNKIFIRYTTELNATDAFVLHSDLQGQYGVGNPETDHMPYLKQFVKDHILL